MQSKAKISGHDGQHAYAAGDTLEVDSEHHRGLLVNGLAEPLDDAAERVANDPAQRARYASPALAALTAEIAAAQGGKKKR